MPPLQELLIKDRLREALDLLLSNPPSNMARSELLELSGRLSDWEQDALRRTETADHLEARRNRIREALLALVERPAPAAARKGMPNLKRNTFRLLVAGKALLLLFVFFHFHTHAFSQAEALVLVGIISPVFVGYLLAAFKSLHKPDMGQTARENPALFRGLAYLGIPLYCMLMLWAMRKVPLDEWPFETARNWMVGIEAAFGGLIAFLVKELFPSSD